MFPTLLREELGVNNAALSYLIREHVVLGVPYYLVSNRLYGKGYTQLMDELVEHAPHDGPSFSEDNATVLRLLHMWSMKPFQRTRDGRGALQAIQRHNMGDSK